ncbi:hypothetical protein BH23BAC1_BH23BAC1_38310 [soil metagenome]
MKKIIGFLKSHIKEDFHPFHYGSNALFLFVTITLNYYLDFEDNVIDAFQGREIRILFYFLFYCFAYYFSCFTDTITSRKNLFYNHEFWIRSVFFLSIISFDAAFYYHRPLVAENFPVELQYFIIKCLNNLVSIFTIFYFPCFYFISFMRIKKIIFMDLPLKGLI